MPLLGPESWVLAKKCFPLVECMGLHGPVDECPCGKTSTEKCADTQVTCCKVTSRDRLTGPSLLTEQESNTYTFFLGRLLPTSAARLSREVQLACCLAPPPISCPTPESSSRLQLATGV